MSWATSLLLRGECPTPSLQHLAPPPVVASKVSVAKIADSGGDHSGVGVGTRHIGKQGLLTGSLQGICTPRMITERSMT